MTQTVQDFEKTFVRAWELLTRNWVIVLPGIVLGVVGGVLSFVLGTILAGSFAAADRSGGDVSYVTQVIYAIASLVVAMLVSIVQMAYVTGMAGAVWERGRTSLGDGWNAFAHRSIQLTFATALLFVIGICAAVLAPVTFFVTIAVYMVFLIYTMASVVIGKREAVPAIAESCRLTLSNIAPTLGIVALIAVIAVVGGLIGTLVGRVTPIGGGLVAGVLQQVIVAYASLVVAGEYLKFSKQPTG